MEGTPAYEDLSSFQMADSLMVPNVLLFCGQHVNLDPIDRQRKLRREMAVFSRFSNTLTGRAEVFFTIVEPILEAHGVSDDFKYLMVIERVGWIRMCGHRWKRWDCGSS